eukprot:TRINITY_DN3101_c0_g1_i3.p1 TRINITY_DN3101_c0_g1~~TRINITY_DN3101_c0_g1_i3.p1  ORF type:complete len:473 (-),score=125.36 TRINITY_DN3101_c0_g1_i3:630-1988(-)
MKRPQHAQGDAPKSQAKEEGKHDAAKFVDKEFGGNLGCLFFSVVLPLVPAVLWLSLLKFRGQLVTPDLWDVSRWPSLFAIFAPTRKAVCIYAVWWVFQTVMYLVVPGFGLFGSTFTGRPILDQKKPVSLSYRLNGLACYAITIAAFFGFSNLGYFNLYKASIVADNVAPLLTVVYIWVVLYSIYLYVRGPKTHSNPYYSGRIFQDFWMGLELNPRSLGNFWDHKYFCEGHPGLNGWVILSFSIAAKQYETYGYVSYSMMASVFFGFLYILDCWIFEPALCNTLDIYYDRFGYMLCFGDLIWVPFTYVFASYKILLNDPNYSLGVVLLIVSVNFVGLFIFRGANLQKHLFRMNPAKWEKRFRFMTTAHGNKLMTGGFWGISRHCNYFGDLIMGFMWCLIGGVDQLINFYYIIYFSLLLIHRAYRDDTRCAQKYGKDWATYCKRVPWRIIPFVY